MRDTRFSNNTIDLSGRGSQGFVCSACSSDVLVMDNNIVRAEGKVGFVGGSFGGDHNLYWGAPMRFRLHPTTSSPTPASCPMRTCISAPPRPRRDSGAPTASGVDLDGTPSRRRPRPSGAYQFRDPTVIEAQPDLQQHDVPLHAHRGIA